MFGKIQYPSTPTGNTVDTYFGIEVPDPYRWLEDADSDAVMEWTQTQADFANEMLSSLGGRETFKKRLTEVWDYPKYGIPRKYGNRLFFTKNDGLQAQSTLYVQDEGGDARVLIDPNALSDDGTVALVDWRPTHDGKYLMYALSESGLDWRTFKIRDVDTGEDFEDTLTHIKFSGAAWRKDNSGFYYARFPEDVEDQGEDNQAISNQLYFHTLGTPQSDDLFVYEHPELKGINLNASVTDDDQYLFVYISGDSFVFNRLYYRSVDSDGDFVQLFDDLDASYELIGTDGTTAYILTTKDAPRQRIVSVDLENPTEMREIIAESDDIIQGVTMANHQFVVMTMHHAHHIVKVFDLDGDYQHDIDLPDMGSTSIYAGYTSHADDTEIFMPFMSYLRPAQILKYDFTTQTLSEFFTTETPDFDPNNYETKQVFFESKDGTTVPMFIIGKRGLDFTGDHPTILYGYGGYDVSLTPGYIAHLPVWLEQGGIYAVANLRGGGEYGEQWHLDGMLDKKQNTFDDFISAAEYLIENKYTSSQKLAIEGGSNGGLLVAACMLQRPNLYGAVLCHVPVIDMLRFQHFTAGRYWTSEYGDANKTEDHFQFLIRYSPLHNVQAGVDYPPILIMSADHDDRVVPMHSKKFAATLQNANNNQNVILLRMDTKAGHGMGKPTAKIIEQRVDVLAFLNQLFNMGVK